MSKLFHTYNRAPLDFVKAKENELIDDKGKSYLDFSSGIGVTNLGYNAKVIEAIDHQIHQILHEPNLYHNQLQEDVAEKLIGEYDYLAFFCNSGTEANEAAIKLARKYTQKPDIITFKQSFHGRTFGAMSATAQEKIQKGFGQLLPGFKYADYNDIESVKALTDANTAAIMLELIQGESGVIPAEESFVQSLATFCKENGILLIVDEVQTGMGRTGTLYAFEQYGIIPDIVSLAKGLANGIPVGAILGKTALSQAFTPGSHGTTFGGNKVAMASSKETLSIMKQNGFLEEVSQKANYLQEQLKTVLSTNPHVKAIRGIGMMIGIETDLPLNELVTKAREDGLIVLTAGTNVIRLLPPLTITREEIDRAVRILKDAFTI